MKPTLLHALIAAAALVPAVASAEIAVTTRSVNMRAGPDVSYPQVTYLPANVSVNVVGCVQGYQWCDVVAGPNRGWVYAGYLSSYYNNAPQVLSYAAPTIGIPLISFSIGPYWDDYYRGRPWWNNRAYWYNRAPHYVEAPRYYGHDNRQWQGNDWRANNNNNRGNDGHANNNRGNDGHANNNRGNERQAGGGIAGPYTRAEGGTHDRVQGARPNDQAHPNQQQ
jgi:uncharacterized protein YraI